MDCTVYWNSQFSNEQGSLNFHFSSAVLRDGEDGEIWVSQDEWNEVTFGRLEGCQVYSVKPAKKIFLNSARFDEASILDVLDEMNEMGNSGAVMCLFDASYDRAQFHTELCNWGLAHLIEPDSRVYGCVNFDA